MDKNSTFNLISQNFSKKELPVSKERFADFA